MISIYKQTTGLLNLKSVVCLQSPKAKLMTNEERSTIFNMAIAEQENITKNVEYEILKVEKLRALIFAIVLGSFAIIIIIASILNIANASFSDKFPIPQNVLEPVVIGFALFELLIWYILKHCLDTGKSVPAICHYIVALVEISLPTMLILIFSHALHVYALFLPAVFMYFLIIALSGLRLNFYICIFTGAVAAIEYVLLALYIINTTEFPVEFHEMGPTYFC